MAGYSSITSWKAKGHTTKNTASKASRNGIQRSKGLPPCNTDVDASTAAMTTGTTTGKNKSGSITSRERVFRRNRGE